MGFLQNVTSESEHINHLEVSVLRRDGDGDRVVREIGAVSDTGVFEARCQFIQLVQYQYGDPHLIIPDRVQMRVTRIDVRMRQ